MYPIRDNAWTVRVWEKLWQRQENFVEVDEGIPRLIPDLWPNKKKHVMIREDYRELAELMETAEESHIKSLIIWGQSGIGPPT